ncbi:MAG: helix-turn-helix transcriptional regulator [Bacteroidales bacterium]|nr:helix-turn-helix transcriptional regulator [Bacteroidales bacterium]
MLRVKNICKQQGITLKQLAERMDVSPEVVTRMLSENGNPTLSSLENIAKALGVEVYELFDNFDADKMVRGYLEVGNKTYRINNFNDLQIVYNKITSGE